jgi:hypothetical protein
MDRPTVRPNFNVIAAHKSSVAARLLAREISSFASRNRIGWRRGA